MERDLPAPSPYAPPPPKDRDLPPRAGEEPLDDPMPAEETEEGPPDDLDDLELINPDAWPDDPDEPTLEEPDRTIEELPSLEGVGDDGVEEDFEMPLEEPPLEDDLDDLNVAVEDLDLSTPAPSTHPRR